MSSNKYEFTSNYKGKYTTHQIQTYDTKKSAGLITFDGYDQVFCVQVKITKLRLAKSTTRHRPTILGRLVDGRIVSLTKSCMDFLNSINVEYETPEIIRD